MKISKEELVEFVTGHYYTDIEEDVLWEPFEYEDPNTIKQYIDSDVESLIKLITKYGGQVE